MCSIFSLSYQTSDRFSGQFIAKSIFFFLANSLNDKVISSIFLNKLFLVTFSLNVFNSLSLTNVNSRAILERRLALFDIIFRRCLSSKFPFFPASSYISSIGPKINVIGV